jgi:hypothetical protein
MGLQTQERKAELRCSDVKIKRMHVGKDSIVSPSRGDDAHGTRGTTDVQVFNKSTSAVFNKAKNISDLYYDRC